MERDVLELLRCPFCGSRLSPVENSALRATDTHIDAGVLGCECCAFPIVEGIPVLQADETARTAIGALESGHPDTAVLTLLDLTGDTERTRRFRALLSGPGPPTYREALEILNQDAEGTYFVYRFSDPTFVSAEAVVRAVGHQQWPIAGRILDLCGGSGHLTRVLDATQKGAGSTTGTVVADAAFWKLWLARRFMAPDCTAVCCDGNHPLPFVGDAFSMVLLSDAFPYIWHKRLLADEMMRVAGRGGAIVMPHLHSAAGENVSAGDTLTPAAYRDLFVHHSPRLFSDRRLLTDLLDREVVDLTADVSAEDLGSEPSLTLIASPEADVFSTHAVSVPTEVVGELRVNPLYRHERRGASTILTLTFPSPEYAEEFGACRRYLPETVTLDIDPGDVVSAQALGADLAGLRRRRVIIDAPPHYG